MRSLRGLAVLAALLVPSSALGRPRAPAALCEARPRSAWCSGRTPACTLCHLDPAPPVAWNAYGEQLREFVGEGSIELAMEAALAHNDAGDADGDGVTNGLEIMQGTEPSDPASGWREVPPPPSAPDARYPIGRWDPEFAGRRARVALCGISPTLAELEDLRGAPDPRAFVHEWVDECLESDAWRDEIVPRLADAKIRPLGGAGACAAYYANFEFDYYLFTYVLTGDRDARDLLRARYHVERAADGALRRIADEGPVAMPSQRGSHRCRDRYGGDPTDPLPNYNGGQPLLPQQRAGMITTQWFLWFHTMGAYLPRQTAAQFYRAYLGFDLSQYEGLTGGTAPVDIDSKGVREARCAVCHSTLDPLAYPFTFYWGGAGDPRQYIARGYAPIFAGQYDGSRPLGMSLEPEAARRWYRDVPVARIFGEPLPPDTPDRPALVELAHRGSDSDAFVRTLAVMFFEHLVGRAPRPEDASELEHAWRAMRSDGYTARGLVHRLVDTLAFGAP